MLKHCLAAAALVLAMPALAAPGEITMSISAQGVVPPDRAMLGFQISGDGKTRAEAEAMIKDQERDLRARLMKAGADAGSISVGKIEEQAPEDALAGSFGPEEYAEAAVAEAAEVTEDMPSLKKKRKSKVDAMEAVDGESSPYVGLKADVTVTVNDLSKLEAISDEGRAYAGEHSTARPIYSMSEPAKAHQRAIAEAIAKARAEADAYAGAMGYRVVRVTRISNDGPGLNISGVMNTLALLGSGTPRNIEQIFTNTSFAGVILDFVIAPK